MVVKNNCQCVCGQATLLLNEFKCIQILSMNLQSDEQLDKYPAIQHAMELLRQRLQINESHGAIGKTSELLETNECDNRLKLTTLHNLMTSIRIKSFLSKIVVFNEHDMIVRNSHFNRILLKYINFARQFNVFKQLKIRIRYKRRMNEVLVNLWSHRHWTTIFHGEIIHCKTRFGKLRVAQFHDEWRLKRKVISAFLINMGVCRSVK